MSNSSIDTYGYIYNYTFLSTSPITNLLAYDDTSAGDNQFQLAMTLQPNNRYYLIVTTYMPNVIGSYTFVAKGSQIFGLGFPN